MKWYGPTEKWPAHPKSHWNDVLREARASGWHLLMLDGHTWGKISCSPGADDAHEIGIYTSGRGSESFVRNTATRIVRSCRHRDLPAAIAARRVLDGADRLLSAAEDALDASDHIQRAMDLVADAGRNVEEAERLFDAGQDQLAEAAQRAALEGVAGTPSEYVDEAERRVGEARQGLPRGPSGDDLRRLIKRSRDRIAALRVRIG